jgi:enoyl-[acyl-carrier protein] reductase II
VEHYWVGALRSAVIDGDTEYGSLMAGQSVGLMKDIKPIKKVMEEFIKEGEEELQKVKSLLQGC